jgi:hypothetical protein
MCLCPMCFRTIAPFFPSTTELVQPPGNYMIDELRAVIGMKAENREGGLGAGEQWNRLTR